MSAVHDDQYVQQLKAWCLADAGRIESDTVVSAGSWEAATMAAGAAIDATSRILKGEAKTAFCAIRPPGHHAIPKAAMGFCLLNNIAIAARHAIDAGASRVLIVDWDVHHGNGTQDAFYDDGQVGFYSIHRSPFYPGTGATEETGTGKGLGWTCNQPVQADIQTKPFLDAFKHKLEKIAEKVRPEIVFISAGFDAHRNDPVGSLCLENEDFVTLTQIVRDVADTFSNGRVVSLLEGGYHLDYLPHSVLCHLEALDDGDQTK